MSSPRLGIGAVGGQLRCDRRALKCQRLAVQRYLSDDFIQGVLSHIYAAPGNIPVIIKFQPVRIQHGNRTADQRNLHMLLGCADLLEAEKIVDPLGIGTAQKQYPACQPADHSLLVLPCGKYGLGHIISGAGRAQCRYLMDPSLDGIGQIFLA